MTLASSSTTEALATARSAPAGTSAMRTYMELTKARLSTLVVFTTAIGYVAAAGWTASWLTMLCAVTGTALCAGCASVLNQIIERDRDGRMERTRHRPIPARDVSLRRAWCIAVVLGVSGLLVLLAGTNVFATSLAALTIFIYAAVYTPMKTRTPMNTLVGAICGAIPPVIGWVAATNRIDTAAWILGGVLFVWQLPHFLALAWMYRDDYARGGFAMLPNVDVAGRWTAMTALATSALLIPLAASISVVDVAGVLYAGCALALGGWMTWLAWRFLQERNDARARNLFLASITYLPLLMIALVIDRSAPVNDADIVAQQPVTAPLIQRNP